MNEEGPGSSETPDAGGEADARLPASTREALSELLANPANQQSIERFIIQVATASESFSGPLPTPRQLEEYERILPGVGEHIVRLTERKLELSEREQNHRHELESLTVRHARWYTSAGLIFGFAISLLLVAGAMAALFVGNSAIAAAFLGAAATGIVTALVRGNFSSAPVKIEEDQT